MGSAITDEEASSSSQASEPVSQESSFTVRRTASFKDDVDPFVDAPKLPPNLSDRAAEAAPMRAMSKLLKGKAKEWSSIAEKRGPLRLLDLPVDILREIINQIPQPNDLTSLALCHSVFHSLAIPCIYARFDIVWPEKDSQAEPRTGVDALTYGLATLVKAEEVFGEAPWQRRARESKAAASSGDNSSSLFPLRRRRRGNNYAQFVKKFSLGNGPPEYVQDYLIAKEGGKMLGTLVALAVARMRNLETFVWDMPTGVLRDVWLALSSLADREDGEDCRLERVWVRWHDNAQLDMMNAVPPPTLPQNNIAPPNGAHNSGNAGAQPNFVVQASHFLGVAQAMERVEHPSFSVLPPLKSLSVLEIDELPYLDEMSILIARSQDRLRELRVGIAAQAEDMDWTQVWEGDSLQQVDYTANSTLATKISNSRLGGVLGVLVGRLYNMRNNSHTAKTSPNLPRGDDIRPLRPSMTSIDGLVQSSFASESAASASIGQSSPGAASSSSEVFTDALSQQTPASSVSAHSDGASSSDQTGTAKASPSTYPSTPTHKAIPLRTLRSNSREARLRGPYLDGKLKLDTLELERVPLCVSVLQRAIDWLTLTSITLLHCQHHESLWKSLRYMYAPQKRPKPHASPLSNGSPYSTPRRTSMSRSSDYPLNLKKIHTNTASVSLVNFIKDTLAPNTLEVFFLQESRVPVAAAVTVDAIYRCIIRRHRLSLKKLMIDSSDPPGNTDYSTANPRWRKWTLTREILSFIMGGKMPFLRELGLTIEYKDWHYFLQHLPAIPHVRSLYIPHIADHPHGADSDPRELALQIVDIVTLKPGIELCYMGIAGKCFEILENQSPSHNGHRDHSADSMDHADGGHAGPSDINGYQAVPGNTGDDALILEEDEDVEPDDEDEEVGLGGGNALDGDVTQSESEEEFQDDDDDDEFGSDTDEDGHGGRERTPRLRLRQIVWYDDKVAIFRARHGRL